MRLSILWDDRREGVPINRGNPIALPEGSSQIQHCLAERSEASLSMGREMLRCAQDDTSTPTTSKPAS